uniref:MRG domain-containing protein n=1 Tax=Arion vulgaris TaxID=1028688 RepID=A0A0B7A8U4_9EUPU
MCGGHSGEFHENILCHYLCDPSGGREKTRNSSSKHTLRCPPDKCISLCKEFVDSLRIIFDFTLPIILLYAAEQQQYESAMKDIKPADLAVRDKEVFGHLMCSTLPSDKSPNRVARSGVLNAKFKPKKTTKQHVQIHQHRSTSPTTSVSSKSSSAVEDSPATPVRRVTRQSVHEVPKSDSQSQKSKQASTSATQHQRSSKHSEYSSPKSSRRSQKVGESVIPIASRTRRRSQFEVVEVSDAPIVKQEPNSDMEMDFSLSDLPGPSQTDQGLMNGLGGPCSAAGTEVLTLGSSRGREDAMDRILGWQLLPPEIMSHGPVTPAQIYGTVHLLRMFVKLPDLLKKMQMKNVQLQIIIKFIHHCLQYLVDHHAELFSEHTYIKA